MRPHLIGGSVFRQPRPHEDFTSYQETQQTLCAECLPGALSPPSKCSLSGGRSSPDEPCPFGGHHVGEVAVPDPSSHEDDETFLPSSTHDSVMACYAWRKRRPHLAGAWAAHPSGQGTQVGRQLRPGYHRRLDLEERCTGSQRREVFGEEFPQSPEIGAIPAIRTSFLHFSSYASHFGTIKRETNRERGKKVLSYLKLNRDQLPKSAFSWGSHGKFNLCWKHFCREMTSPRESV